MKFCAKCGKEIHDEAVICVHCGCAVASSSKTSGSGKSTDGKFLSFVNDSKSIFVLGIVSLLLSLGIGIIFQIINLVKLKKYTDKASGKITPPEFDLTDSGDLIMYEDAKKKLKLGQILTSIGLIITGLSLFVLVMVIAVGAQI